MHHPQRTLSTLTTRLDEVEDALRAQPRLAPADLVALIRSRCDLSLVPGAEAVDDPAHTAYPNPAIGSSSQIDDALLLDQLVPGQRTWSSAAVDADPAEHVGFIFPLAMGNGSATPQPTVTFALDVEGREIARFCLVKGTRQWVGQNGLLSFVPQRVDSTPFGRAFAVDDVLLTESTVADGYAIVLVERALVAAGRPNRMRLRALSEHPSRNWCRVGVVSPWLPLFTAEAHFDALRRAVRPRGPRRFGDFQLLLGDLHSHSGESRFLDDAPPGVGADEPCGIGSRASMFEYSRDIAQLDVFCLSEHDWQMDDRDWGHLQSLNEHFLSDSFIPVHGYEWTSQRFGHRNVYFGDRAGALHHSTDPRIPYGGFVGEVPSPRDLWVQLRNDAVPAVTIPHHMSAAQFPLDLRDHYDPDFDRVAEIYSAWGDSLEHGQQVSTGAARIERLEFVRAIRNGFRVGFIASSDSHDGHPGHAQGTPGRPHLYHHLGSGRAGLFTDVSDRQAVFEALRNRRTFAATGDGLSVWTALNEDPMGSESTVGSGSARFDLLVDSDLPISSVTVYRNGRRAEAVDVLGERTVETYWTERPRRDARTENVFVKVVRCDGEIAWSSPHWLR